VLQENPELFLNLLRERLTTLNSFQKDFVIHLLLENVIIIIFSFFCN
jgi:hypothetical protein